MELTIRPEENRNYYLYSIKNSAGEIIFIGADRLVDIVTFRQVLPAKIFDKKAIYTIEIYTNHVDRLNAMNHMAKLTRLLCGDKIPILNSNIRKQKVGRILCSETGVIYNSQSEVCRALHIDAPRLSKHLSGEKGHRSIKGLSFVRVE